MVSKNSIVPIFDVHPFNVFITVKYKKNNSSGCIAVKMAARQSMKTVQL